LQAATTDGSKVGIEGISPTIDFNHDKLKSLATTTGGPNAYYRSESKERGRVCLFCDRKFILYETYSEFSHLIGQWDTLIKDDQSVLRVKNLEYTEARSKMKSYQSELSDCDRKLQRLEIDTRVKSENLDRQKDQLC
jgi:hypothetical protein